MENRLTLPEILKAVDRMAIEGSDYEKKLAELFYLADMQQLITLKVTFREILNSYLK